ALGADVLAVGDPAREHLEVRLDAEGFAPAFHLFAEDKDVAYEAASFTTSVTPVDGGVEVRVTASSLVRDLALLVDKVHPDAVVDAQLVTLAAGDEVVLHVSSDVELDAAELVSPRVLRSVNALVRGA